MDLPVINIPRATPVQIERPPQENIPPTRQQREQIRAWLKEFVATEKPVPPLPMSELRAMAESFAEAKQIDAKYVDYVGVLLNSEVWKDSLASVPYNRRLLLLPKCLRIEDQCPAPFDEFGLLCKQCGLCSIQDLQEEAEKLGYAVLVAEGSALVMAIVQTGKIDAIVGVSCLSVLEKAFPYMESAAIPGVAVPLLQDDCKDVTVDLDWVWEVIHLTSDDRTYRLNLDTLRTEVQTWFESDSLAAIMGPAHSETERIARSWLAKDGKRWRPFLAACAWKAMQDDPETLIPDHVKKIAVAVECFHKASLVHDDIEDDDDIRYGEPALHQQHGTAIALNVGDLLLGDGYRLIGECNAPGVNLAAMLQAAAAGHSTLCLGQGAELCWAQNPQPLSTLEVLDIFRQKTSPAFEVALAMGCAATDDYDSVKDVLREYSNALGIAYQIRDDLDDLIGQSDTDDLQAMRPSLPLALAYERTKAKPDERALLTKAWRRECNADELEQVRALMKEYGIEDRCKVLLESYKEEAVRSLAKLQNASLKGLLRRVISKIFTVELKGWCSEFETRNAASSTSSAEVAG
ncbi:MAG: polyprenyl synthetase family protein [Pirellulaceae bacterium]